MGHPAQVCMVVTPWAYNNGHLPTPTYYSRTDNTQQRTHNCNHYKCSLQMTLATDEHDYGQQFSVMKMSVR